MVRTALVTATSLALTGAVVSHAYLLKQQFYPTVVHLRNSSPSMAVLYLQALVLLYLVARILRALFFGRLSAGETERLVERCGYAVTETCVAFTVFRDDLSPRFVALFTLLLFLKCFHWLAEDRVDFMERSPAVDPESVSWLFHLRVRSLLSLLAVLDFLFVRHACRSVASNGLSVQLVFGVEYAVLLTMALTTLAKYLLHSAELRRGPLAWEHKSVYMLYVELLTGTVTVLLHLAFVGVMLRAHSFPLFATRPLYLATRRLRRALTDAVMSRRAVRQMNALYPDATAADLRGPSSDNVCAVCREEMLPGGGAKKLPCGHIFHMGCLRSWFQRQRTCPVCRADVLRAQAAPAPTPTPAPPAPPTTPPAADDAQAPRTLPPGFPPVALFPFWAPFSGAPPPGADTDTAQSHAEEEDEEEATGETLPPGFPPFSFSAAPWLLHMPPAPTPSPVVSSTPPPLLSRQSEEEQEAARGRRLLCLQDIHSLLDAAMLNIHHYLSTLAPPPAPPSGEAADRPSPTQNPPPAAQTPGQQSGSQTL